MGLGVGRHKRENCIQFFLPRIRNYKTYISGIHGEIARARHEYWSAFAPLPTEVVLAAGQKARDENSMGNILSERQLWNNSFTCCFNVS